MDLAYDLNRSRRSERPVRGTRLVLWVSSLFAAALFLVHLTGQLSRSAAALAERSDRIGAEIARLEGDARIDARQARTVSRKVAIANGLLSAQSFSGSRFLREIDERSVPGISLTDLKFQMPQTEHPGAVGAGRVQGFAHTVGEVSALAANLTARRSDAHGEFSSVRLESTRRAAAGKTGLEFAISFGFRQGAGAPPAKEDAE